MITKVELKYFKLFKEVSLDLTGNVVLAGPNNSGKTTLIQAILTWNLAIKKWLQEKSSELESKSKKKASGNGKKRPGIQLMRSEFTAIPLREMDLLWHERSTGLKKDELAEDQRLGAPKHLEIRLFGESEGQEWVLGMQFTYRYPDLVWVRPTDDSNTEIAFEILKHHSILVIPSFSGIGITETRYDKPFQEMLIGQGKPGDLIRNKLLEVFEKKDNRKSWNELVKMVQDIFGYTLLPPQYNGLPYIVSEYLPFVSELKDDRPKSSDVVLDISSAGSGFLQVVLLLGFVYSQSASLVLLDEPDAHLHVILQKQVYDRLKLVFSSNKSQLIIATHSEVIIDNTSPEGVLSFYKSPHRLKADFESEQVQAALRVLSSMDILFADRWPYILYLEGKSDFNLLREWAKVLNHPLSQLFNSNSQHFFWHNNVGRNPKSAKEHLFALKAINPAIKGVLLLDGDARGLGDHEIRQDGLEIIRWKRYEAENYLLHTDSLLRFIAGGDEYLENPDLFVNNKIQNANKYLSENILPINLSNPFLDNDFQENMAASKSILPGLFQRCDLSVSKSEYYTIASQMKREEIHPEIIEKLDFLNTRFTI